MSSPREVIRVGRLKMGIEPGNRHAALIQVTIPSWKPQMVVAVPFRPLPKELRNAIVEHFAEVRLTPFFCSAEVDIDVETWEDLVFRNWEVSDGNSD